MATADIVVLLVTTGGVGVLSCLFVVPRVRWQIRLWGSSRWPITFAIVHMAGAERLGGNELEPAIDRSLFGYAYKVDGRRYAGFFAIATDDIGEAGALQSKLEGRTISVRYDPTNPGTSILVERRIDGRLTTQSPGMLSLGNDLQQLFLRNIREK